MVGRLFSRFVIVKMFGCWRDAPAADLFRPGLISAYLCRCVVFPSQEYNWGMRVKTSVTLPSSLLKEIDRLDSNRSAFLERAALSFIGKRVKSELDARDAAILDRVAGELNQQSDVLEFQGLPK